MKYKKLTKAKFTQYVKEQQRLGFTNRYAIAEQINLKHCVSYKKAKICVHLLEQIDACK